MVQIHFANKVVTLKIVYDGPGLAGKTTNLEVIQKKSPGAGPLTSTANEGDRTLAFEMPLRGITIGGMAARASLHCVPRACYYNATRKYALQGADGVVFVADSQADKLEENVASFQNLVENLRELGVKLEELPLVFQWNKRDLPSVVPVEELARALDAHGRPAFEAVAVTGENVFPTLRTILELAIDRLERLHGLKRSEYVPSFARSEPEPPAPLPAPGPTPPAPEPGSWRWLAPVGLVLVALLLCVLGPLLKMRHEEPPPPREELDLSRYARPLSPEAAQTSSAAVSALLGDPDLGLREVDRQDLVGRAPLVGLTHERWFRYRAAEQGRLLAALRARGLDPITVEGAQPGRITAVVQGDVSLWFVPEAGPR